LPGKAKRRPQRVAGSCANLPGVEDEFATAVDIGVEGGKG
jgi:hypothetical protein